jgi:hypothetical protein
MQYPPRHGRTWSRVLGAALGALGLTLAVPGVARAEGRPIPAGYTVTHRETPAEGVDHLVLTRANPPVVAHVARIAPAAPVSLRAVLSNDTVAGEDPRLETTSRMCARVHCVLGINADFAGVGTNEPLGAFVTDGELLRSPSATHHQLSLTAEGTLTDETFTWTGKLVPTADLQPVSLDGVNVARPGGRIVLYTPAYGPTTKTAPGVDLVLRIVEPKGEFRLGQTALVEMLALNEGAQDGPIPPDGAILSADGPGAEALRGLWSRVGAGKALLRLAVEKGPAILESVGGSPILVKDGKRWFTDPGDNFTNGRHPRTMVGWTPGGDTLLVTVDGRQLGTSVGMTLFEAADFLIGLGATEGINLDGGGSTTFVRDGRVVNSPSDAQVRAGGKTVGRHSTQKADNVVARVERPVASALVVVPSIAVAAPPADPFAGIGLGSREQALAFPGRSPSSGARPDSTPSTLLASHDPASSPDGRLPALVGPRPEVGSPLMRIAVIVDVLAIAGVASGALAVRRRGILQRPAPGRVAPTLPDQGTPLLSD